MRFDDSDMPETNDDLSGDAPIEIPIEDAIDLHWFEPRDALPVVEEYLEQAAALGFREVRVIHGRGIGERRRQVHELLARHPLVERFKEAPPGRGGWGATLVWLKPRDSTTPSADTGPRGV